MLKVQFSDTVLQKYNLHKLANMCVLPQSQYLIKNASISHT